MSKCMVMNRICEILNLDDQSAIQLVSYLIGFFHITIFNNRTTHNINHTHTHTYKHKHRYQLYLCEHECIHQTAITQYPSVKSFNHRMIMKATRKKIKNILYTCESVLSKSMSLYNSDETGKKASIFNMNIKGIGYACVCYKHDLSLKFFSFLFFKLIIDFIPKA